MFLGCSTLRGHCDEIYDCVKCNGCQKVQHASTLHRVGLLILISETFTYTVAYDVVKEADTSFECS